MYAYIREMHSHKRFTGIYYIVFPDALHLYLFDSLPCKFIKTFMLHSADSYICFWYLYAVKGLQILAMFPGDVFPIPKLLFENILRRLMSVITQNFNKTILWEVALEALVHIGSFIQKFHESEKAMSYRSFVVEKIVDLLSLDDTVMPFPIKLQALSDIGMTGMKHMLKVLQGLEGVVFANLSEVFVCI